MSASTANPGSFKGRGTPSSWRCRGYALAVTALAVFVIALSALRDQPAEYVAIATLAPLNRPAQEAAGSLAGLKQSLTTPAAIREAAAEAGLAESPPIAPAQIRRGLAIHLERSGTGSDPVVLSLSGSDGHRTVALLNALAQHANQMPSEQRAPGDYRGDQVAQALQAAAEAQEELRIAQRELDAFLAANQARLSASEPDPAAADPPPTPPSEAELAAANRVEQLRHEIHELDRLREVLLRQMEPTHPRFQILLDRIDRLTAELNKATRGMPAHNPAPPDAAKRDAARLAAREARQRLLDTQQRLRQTVSDAEGRYDMLAQAAETARREAERQQPQPAWHVEPSLGARRIPHSTPLPVVLFAAALSVMAGSGTLLASKGGATIDRPAEATAALGLPVLGSLPEPGEPVGTRPRRAGRGLRMVLLASEIILAAFLLAAMTAAMLDANFAAQWTTDPLSALTDGLRHLGGILQGNKF